MTDDEILRRAIDENTCRMDGSTFRVLVAEVKRLRSELDQTAADVLAVVEGREPETWAWPLHSLRDALVAARAEPLPPWSAPGCDGAFEDFGRWENWIYFHMDESLPDDEPLFFDSLDSIHKAYLYNIMTRLADRNPSLAMPDDRKAVPRG